MAAVRIELGSINGEETYTYGSQTALKAYEELRGVLLRYLRANLRSDEDARDMAQEVYLRIAKQFRHEEINCLKSFVLTIARNLLRDNSRRCATRMAAKCVSIDDAVLLSPIGDPLEQIEVAEITSKVRASLAKLQPKCRQAYLLSRMKGLSYDDIAKRMNISVSMVEKHISAALRALRSDCPMH